MPLVKLHVPTGLTTPTREALVTEIRSAMVQTLGIRPEAGHVILYESDERAAHESINSGFVWVEVAAYAGRSTEQKQALLEAFLRIIEARTGLRSLDVNLVILESDKSNWAGGK